MATTKFLYRLSKGGTDYIIKDKENEQRFAAGVLKVENGGTGAQGQSELKALMLDMIYPVGSIYMSTNSTDPGTLFGGTWVQIQDRFLLAAGNTYTAGNTGGAASTAYTPAGTVGGTSLIQEQMPAHTHSFTPAGTVANHSHSFTPAGSISGSASGLHTHTGNSHTHNVKGASHDAVIYVQDGTASGSDIVPSGVRFLKAGSSFVNSSSESPSGKKIEGLVTAGPISAGETGPVSASTIAAALSFSGTAGNSGNTQPSFAGTAGTTGITGGGAAHDHSFTGTQASIATMPPYQVVYMWKRVADPTT